MKLQRRHLIAPGLALLLLAGCSIHVKDGEDASNGDNGRDKDVTIKSPLGGMHVRTNDVDPKQIGLSVYPGARLKENEKGDDSKADVNIDTPWFGLKVVALTYESDDPQDKIWDYYKKELSKYGKVLECKPGSPDMDIVGKNKDDLTCHDSGGKEGRNLNISPDEPHLKVGSKNHQRVVAFKHSSGPTKFSLVYVAVRGDEKDAV